MHASESYSLITAPREGVNDDVVRLVRWLVDEGQKVEKDAPVAVLETTKATFDLLATRNGFLFHLAGSGHDIPVGEAIAAICDQPLPPSLAPVESPPPQKGTNSGQVITERARSLMTQHGLTAESFVGLQVIRASDVEAFRQSSAQPALPAASIDSLSDLDLACDTPLNREIRTLLDRLRDRMRARFNRHVPIGELLSDRWEIARKHGFGERTSAYDSAIVLGTVSVGTDCWIGPNVILDGFHAPLKIGNHVGLGAGTQVYTHNTIEQMLTGNQASAFTKATQIGNCCFLAPQVIIAPGTVIGDHCFVAAGSYVEGVFPAFSYIAGNPATRVGIVELSGNRARVRHGI